MKSKPSFQAQSAESSESKATTLMPASQARVTMSLSAVSEAALMAMASTPRRMSSASWLFCCATEPSPFRTTKSSISPSALAFSACSVKASTIWRRQVLP